MVTQIMSLTNVAFFGLAGASLKLVRPLSINMPHTNVPCAASSHTYVLRAPSHTK
jgi:hypothetical protein